jgi:hypothetical protein
VFATGSLPLSAAGAFDVWLSWPKADDQGRAVKTKAVGTISGTSALWVSPDRGVAVSGRLGGGQAADSTVAPGRRVAGAAEQTQNCSARSFDGLADHGDASEPCLDLGLHRGRDRAVAGRYGC